MAVPLIPVLTVLFACFIGAIGAFYLKKEASKVSFKRLRLTPLMLLGVFCYGVSSVLFILALKGNDLSLLYPLVSTTYVWIALFSWRFLGERMSRNKLIGIAFILVGVSIVGLFH